MAAEQHQQTDAEVNARLVREWRDRAATLERQADLARLDGATSGREGAEDLDAAALDYRQAADELEFDGALGEGRR
jgi:hypothetical protein